MPETRSKQLVIRIGPSEKEKLFALAEEEKRSASDMVRILVLRAYDEAHPPKARRR